MTKDVDICEKIEKDEFYQHFLDNNNVSELKTALSISDQISKLSEGLELLSTELQSQVREQYGALLSQANHAGKLNSAINSVSAHVEQLQGGADKLKNQINIPYNLLNTQTKVLGRLHDASHLLRQSGRFLQLFKKLEATKVLSEQATVLFELEQLTEDQDLNRIDFIRDEKATVATIKQRLVHVANRDLANGLQKNKEDQVKNCLQIFFNLQTLPKCLENLLETFINDIKHSIKECFAGTDISNLQKTVPGNKTVKIERSQMKGPGKTPTLTTSQHFRTKLWLALDWLFDEEIYGYCQQVLLLNKSLSNLLLSDDKSEFKNMHEKFWRILENLLISSFKKSPSHVLQCLQQGLPKLLSSAKSLEKKLESQFTFSDTVFSSLEAGYLEKCANNLKSALIGCDYPNQEVVDNLLRVSSSELSAAIVDNRLCSLVSGVFCVCNKELWSKIEGHVKLGTDAQQVVDNPNVCQLQNTSLANIIFYHNESVQRMMANLGSSFANTEAAEKICQNMNEGKTITLAILQQLIASINSALNIILLSMHREPGLNSSNISTSGPSLYMKELHEFVFRAWNAHILPFNDQSNVEQCGKDLAIRCIELFIQNVSTVRPISATGRLRLKSDCSHLENALKPIINDLSNLGKNFRLLRAISTLIILSPQDLVDQTSDFGGAVPPHIVLLMLFGHAGNDLTSPHLTAGWSNEKLLQWFDGHTSEKDRLELITGALQKYRNVIRQKNIAHYDSVYPLISNYLENALKMF